jgi:hypothetical protein
MNEIFMYANAPAQLPSYSHKVAFGGAIRGGNVDSATAGYFMRWVVVDVEGVFSSPYLIIRPSAKRIFLVFCRKGSFL